MYALLIRFPFALHSALFLIHVTANIPLATAHTIKCALSTCFETYIKQKLSKLKEETTLVDTNAILENEIRINTDTALMVVMESWSIHLCGRWRA